MIGAWSVTRVALMLKHLLNHHSINAKVSRSLLALALTIAPMARADCFGELPTATSTPPLRAGPGPESTRFGVLGCFGIIVLIKRRRRFL
jgi:hypothetical protein